MNRFIVLGLASSLATVVGCGGKSARVIDGDDDGSDAAGTSGTSAGGASSTGGANTGGTAGRDECRPYAARYATGSEVETECDFERASLSLRCASSTGETSVTSWDTIDAALSENQPTGRVTFSTFTSEAVDCKMTIATAYDALGRPTSQVTTTAPDGNCPNNSLTYSAWDDFGRPLAAVSSSAGSSGCRGQDHSFGYDDANRKLVERLTGGTGSECYDLVFTYAYGADGLIDQITITFRDIVSSLDFVTLETGQICRS